MALLELQRAQSAWEFGGHQFAQVFLVHTWVIESIFHKINQVMELGLTQLNRGLEERIQSIEHGFNRSKPMSTIGGHSGLLRIINRRVLVGVQMKADGIF